MANGTDQAPQAPRPPDTIRQLGAAVAGGQVSGTESLMQPGQPGSWSSNMPPAVPGAGPQGTMTRETGPDQPGGPTYGGAPTDSADRMFASQIADVIRQAVADPDRYSLPRYQAAIERLTGLQMAMQGEKAERAKLEDIATAPSQREEFTARQANIQRADPTGMKRTLKFGPKGEMSTEIAPLAGDEALRDEYMRTHPGASLADADTAIRTRRTDITTTGQERVMRTRAAAWAEEKLRNSQEAADHLTKLDKGRAALAELEKEAPEGRLPGSPWARNAPMLASQVADGLDPGAKAVFEHQMAGWLSNPDTVGEGFAAYHNLYDTYEASIRRRFGQAPGGPAQPPPAGGPPSPGGGLVWRGGKWVPR